WRERGRVLSMTRTVEQDACHSLQPTDSRGSGRLLPYSNSGGWGRSRPPADPLASRQAPGAQDARCARAEPRRSAPLPHRLSLLEEGGEPLARVLEGEHPAELSLEE